MRQESRDRVDDRAPERQVEERRSGDERGARMESMQSPESPRKPRPPATPNLPAGVREKLERMRQGRPDRVADRPPERPVKQRRSTGVFATGKTATIAGYPAKKYVFTSGEEKGRLWVTDAIARRPEFELWRMQFYVMKDLAAALEDLDAFPLRTHIKTRYDGRRLFMLTEVVDVHPGSAPQDLVTVPLDFKKRAATRSSASQPPGTRR